MNENIIVPPPPSTLSSQIETGAGGVQTQITEKKNSDKGCFLLVFFLQLYFLRFKMVETFIGGGGGVQLFIIIFFFFFFFFFFGGGGGVGFGGMQILISIESLYNL